MAFRRIAQEWLLPLVVFAGVVVVWEALGRFFQWPDYVIPLPSIALDFPLDSDVKQ